MSKIKNIRKLAKEGQGSQKMIDYRLWYIDSLEAELDARELVSKPHGEGIEYASLMIRIAASRAMADSGKCTLEEAEANVRQAHKYEKFLVDRKKLKK